MPSQSARSALLWSAGLLSVVFAIALIVRRAPQPISSQSHGISSAAPSLSTPAAPQPPPAPLNKAEVDAAIGKIQEQLSKAALSTSDPWQLALATRALGPSYDLQGKPALGLLLARLQTGLTLIDGQPSLPNPSTQNPPSAAFLAVLLEAGTALDQVVTSEFPLRVWLSHTRQAMSEAATTDEQWERRSWAIDALALGLPSADEKDDKDAAAAKEQLANVLAAAVAKLERENAVFRKWAGEGAQGLAAASNELQRLQRTRSGIYALEGWGLPLTQSVLRGFVQLKEAGQVDPHLELAAGNLIGALAMRYSLERATWAQAMRRDPQATEIDFVDYNALMLETYGWARLIFARTPNDAGLGDTALSCANTLLHLVASPAAAVAPSGERAGGIAQGSLVLANSNALRALRMTRRILWPAVPR